MGSFTRTWPRLGLGPWARAPLRNYGKFTPIFQQGKYFSPLRNDGLGLGPWAFTPLRNYGKFTPISQQGKYFSLMRNNSPRHTMRENIVKLDIFGNPVEKLIFFRGNFSSRKIIFPDEKLWESAWTMCVHPDEELWEIPHNFSSG